MAYTAADLELAEYHTADGEWRVARQQRIVIKLARESAPERQLERSRELLGEFNAALRTCRAVRELIAESLRSTRGAPERLRECGKYRANR
jgi:hypothetical protein